MSGRAKFVYWQESSYPDIPPAPMFNVMSNDSTVDRAQLLDDYGIDAPPFPTIEKWREEITAKRRCFRCWATIRGQRDLTRHRENVHHENLFVQDIYEKAVARQYARWY